MKNRKTLLALVVVFLIWSLHSLLVEHRYFVSRRAIALSVLVTALLIFLVGYLYFRDQIKVMANLWLAIYLLIIGAYLAKHVISRFGWVHPGSPFSVSATPVLFVIFLLMNKIVANSHKTN